MHDPESAPQALLTKPASKPKPFRFPADRPQRLPGDPSRPPASGPSKGASRRIFDLARDLNCFGYFLDDDQGPRAA